MKYDLTKPCANCPFRSDIRPYITEARVGGILDKAFSCHKTTTEKGRGNRHPDAQHCAGSLILHEKMSKPHQMMRIAERLGMYDHRKLKMDSPVYGSAEEMLRAHRDAEKPISE